MTRFARPAVATICACLLLAACAPAGDEAQGQTGAPEGEEPGYLAPPSVSAVAAGPGGSLSISGRTQPGARVRLSPSSGEAPQFAQADLSGAWRAEVRVEGGVRLFSLSAAMGERTVQAEGYLLLTPDGQGAVLRSGAGAKALAGPSEAPKILTVDYDRDRAAVVSGIAKPGAGLAVRIDRAPGGDVKAGPDGRFTFPLSAPLGPGPHLVDVAGEGGVDAVQITAGVPAGVGVLSGARGPEGWRIDWTTPGGGAQTTLLLARPKDAM